MTKTTEELKREMSGRLHLLKHGTETIGQEQDAEKFESALEEYLEALRQEGDSLIVRLQGENERNLILLDAYRQQQTLTMQARGEADSYRNKLQAFEFANQSAGEFLKEARAKVKAQRQSIGQLKNERDNAKFTLKVRDTQLQKALQELQEARQVIGSTIAQNRRVLISCAKCGGSGRELVGMRIQDDTPVTVPCSKCAHLRTAPEPKMEFVFHAEFDNFIRISCTACGQEKDVPK